MTPSGWHSSRLEIGAAAESVHAHRDTATGNLTLCWNTTVVLSSLTSQTLHVDRQLDKKHKLQESRSLLDFNST